MTSDIEALRQKAVASLPKLEAWLSKPVTEHNVLDRMAASLVTGDVRRYVNAVTEGINKPEVTL